MAHTPGNWTYQALAGNHDFAVYGESDGKDIAIVRNFNEANAQLIATAPEMLEALEDCIDELMAWTRGAKPSDYPNEPLITTTVIENAKQALAKAKGQEVST